MVRLFIRRTRVKGLLMTLTRKKYEKEQSEMEEKDI